MSSLSFLNLKNLTKGECQIFIETKETMNAMLFKSVSEYQRRAKIHAKYLTYSMSNLPAVNQTVIPFDFGSVKQLAIGMNQNIQILVKILRIMRIKENLICLAADQWSKVQKTYVIICIMFTSCELASNWHLANGYLCELAAFFPYLNYQSKYKQSFVLVKYDNIRIIKTSDNKFKKTSEEIKTIANAYFNKHQYIQALIGYELSLGLLVDNQKHRQRAVLYANSSQCFYKLRLYQNALTYADIAIYIDQTYIKSLYRKFNSLIELNNFKQIPKLLSLVAKYGNQTDLKQINEKYRRHMQNNIGIFNWKHIFSDGLLQFNQYTNEKLQMQKNEANDPKYPYYYVTQREIKKFQLIAVMKPLQYFLIQSDAITKARQNQEELIKKIYFLTILQQRFKSIIAKLPRRSFMNKNQGQSKIAEICYVNIITPKNIHPNGQVYGIWPQFYKFKHECQANCSYVVINGGLFIFATKKIAPSETLTIDYVQNLFKQRYIQLNPKQINICFCCLCNYDWNDFSINKNGVSIYQTEKNNKNSNSKLLLMILWQIILMCNSNYLKSSSTIFKELIKELNRYPDWNIFYNILKGPLKDILCNHYKQDVEQLLVNYFKVNIKTAHFIISTIIKQ